MELRKKYLYVLDISGKRDEEITTIVMNRAEREEAATAAEVAEGFADSLRRPVGRTHHLKSLVRRSMIDSCRPPSCLARRSRLDSR